MSPKSFGTSATIRSRSPSRSPPDASTDAFSSSLTPTGFSQRSMRRLEASLRRAAPKGHKTFISRTAPHQGLVPTSGPPCVQDTPRHAQDALADALMRRGGVVVLLVFGQDGSQVRFAEDEAAVKELAPQGAGEALADRVHPRRLHSSAQDRGAGGLEDGVEGAGEVRSAVTD